MAAAAMSLTMVAVALGPVSGVAADSTSDAAQTVDGRYTALGRLRTDDTLDLVVAGRGGVPERNVGAVVLNVTVTDASKASFLTVWPSGELRPTASNLNFAAGQTSPNMVITKVGDAGMVSIFNQSGAVDVIVDVLGWFPTSSSYTGVSPARLLDTRPRQATIDGLDSGAGQVGAASTTTLRVVGRGGVPSSGVGAVALNVTAVQPTADTYVTVWPTGSARPTASNLNATAGSVVSNMVIAKVGADGTVSVFNFAGATDLVVDVMGWFPLEHSSLTALSPARLYETRPGLPTVDGRGEATIPVRGGSTAVVPIAGRGGVPRSGAGAVALNVTVTNPSAASFLTVWPGDGPRPTASNLNMVPGQTVANMVIVPLGADGSVSVFAFAGEVDVVIDVLGWFPSGDTFTALVPARLLDTRGSSMVSFGPGDYFPVGGDVPAGRYAFDTIFPGICQWTITSTGAPFSFQARYMDVTPDIVRLTFLGGCGALSTWVERPALPPATPFVIDGIDATECAAGSASITFGMGTRRTGSAANSPGPTFPFPAVTVTSSGSRRFGGGGVNVEASWTMTPGAPCSVTLTPVETPVPTGPVVVGGVG